MTARHKALLLWLIIIFLAACGLAGCSAGKKMVQEEKHLQELKQLAEQERKKIAAEAVYNFVKDNPCQPVPEINLDSVCYICTFFNSGITKETTGNDYILGTVIPNPESFRERDLSGIGLMPKPVVKLIPWVDTRLLNLLEDSITEKDKRLAVAAALLSSKDADCIKAAVNAKKKLQPWLWALAGIAAVLFILLLIIIRKKVS